MYVKQPPLLGNVLEELHDLLLRTLYCKRCAMPGHGHDFSPLSGDAWACVKRWGHSQDGIGTTCSIVTLLRSVGKPYAGDQVKDDAEDVLKRKWLKLAYRRL